MSYAAKVILSYKADQRLIDFIALLGIKVILSMKNEQVMQEIADHPDIFIFSWEEQMIIDPTHFDYYNERLPEYNIRKGSTSASIKYPDDTLYNAVRSGNYLIHGPSVDRVVKSSSEKHIEVRQGYVRCNVLKIDEKSLITSDQGIYSKLEPFYDVLLIEPGHIALDGMPYGFIGGTSGRVSENKILFTGNIESHPDYLRIKTFIESRGVEMLYPESCELIDLGSVIPVFEMEEK
jgi:hypothetical protein